MQAKNRSTGSTQHEAYEVAVGAAMLDRAQAACPAIGPDGVATDAYLDRVKRFSAPKPGKV